MLMAKLARAEVGEAAHRQLKNWAWRPTLMAKLAVAGAKAEDVGREGELRCWE